MIENVSTQLTVFHCFGHCLLPGRAFASLYTLLFLEKEAEIGGRVNIIEKDYDADFQHFFKKYWKRFLDGCFIPWTKSEAELKAFHGILNNLHKDIKFTIQSSPNEQPFLDVMVQNKDGRLETDIYYKETDSKQYSVRNKQLPTCPPRVEFAGGKLGVSEGCPLDNLKF